MSRRNERNSVTLDESTRAEAKAAVLRIKAYDAEAAEKALRDEGGAQLERLIKSSALLALPGADGALFPAFQFDETSGRVRGVVADVNATLNAKEDPWGVASWWVSEHARIGVAPMTLVGNGSEASLRLLVGIGEETSQALRPNIGTALGP